MIRSEFPARVSSCRGIPSSHRYLRLNSIRTAMKNAAAGEKRGSCRGGRPAAAMDHILVAPVPPSRTNFKRQLLDPVKWDVGTLYGSYLAANIAPGIRVAEQNSRIEMAPLVNVPATTIAASSRSRR